MPGAPALQHTYVASDADVGGSIVLRYHGPGAQHGDAHVPKNIVPNAGPEAPEQAVRPWALPAVPGNANPLIDQVKGDPLPAGGAVHLPALREAAVREGFVENLELAQDGLEAALQQLHVVLLCVPGEVGRGGEVGQEEDLGLLDGGPAAEVAALLAHAHVDAAHARPGVAWRTPAGCGRASG